MILRINLKYKKVNEGNKKKIKKQSVNVSSNVHIIVRCHKVFQFERIQKSRKRYTR